MQVFSRLLSSAGAPQSWKSLGEFVVREADSAVYTQMVANDGLVRKVIGSNGKKASAQPAVDFSKFEREVVHSELVTSMKVYYKDMEERLNAAEKRIMAEKKAKLSSEESELLNSAIQKATDATAESERLLASGAKALYISANAPAISDISQSEWVDTDQYWSAFFEKHTHYANFLNTSGLDPESKEYDAAMQSDLMKRFKTFDDRSVTPMNNKLLYQRPSGEFYDVYRSALVEHMIFYLTRTGESPRTFPEIMPLRFFNELYKVKSELWKLMIDRKAKIQESTLARAVKLDYVPEDLEHDGPSYYEGLIKRENAALELTVGRLMGSYLFLNKGIGFQTAASVEEFIGKNPDLVKNGAFYTLGEDVSAVFFALNDKSDLVAKGFARPSQAFESWSSHLEKAHKQLNPVYMLASKWFYALVGKREESWKGQWFTSGESDTAAEAFLRRLKADADPALHKVYADYVSEMNARWTSATVVPMNRVKEVAAAKEKMFTLELAEFEKYANDIWASNGWSKNGAEKAHH